VTGSPLALLLDFDGVLRRWDAARAHTLDLERRHGLAPGTMAALAFDPQRLGPALVGAVPDEAWRLALARALQPLCGQRAAELVADWSEAPGEVDLDVLALVRQVRGAGHPVVLVADATTRLEFDLVRLGLHEELDAVVSSARVGATKPDRRIFAAATAAATVPAGRCLFVDDTEGHVRGAEAAGLGAHHYVDAADLAGALAQARLLPPAEHAT
jgi:putative hydrolase of the HAD superfamily